MAESDAVRSCGLGVGVQRRQAARIDLAALHKVCWNHASLQRFAQCSRSEVQMLKLGEWKPAELQPATSFNAEVTFLKIQNVGAERQRDQKIQADLVMRLACMVKEVFANAKQFVALHGQAQFLLKLSDYGLGRFLTRFHAASGKCPESISLCSVQQKMPLLEGDGAHAKLKAASADSKTDHGSQGVN